jgi:EpsI family protein
LSRALIAASILLVGQAALVYSSVRREFVPEGRPLAEFPAELGAWRLHSEGVVEQEVRDVLRADDLLSRFYTGDGAAATLFIAAFRSQRNGKAPHSPKNCLPGGGWMPLISEQRTVDIAPGVAIPVNRYVVARGDSRSVVMYWYQSRDRAVASEYTAKFYVIADAIRYNRTDTALVRVVTAAEKGREDEATAKAESLIRAAYPRLREFLPQ